VGGQGAGGLTPPPPPAPAGGRRGGGAPPPPPPLPRGAAATSACPATGQHFPAPPVAPTWGDTLGEGDRVPRTQRDQSVPAHAVARARLLEDLPLGQRAGYAACHGHGASAWLAALPTPGVKGTAIHGAAMHAATRMWLGRQRTPTSGGGSFPAAPPWGPRGPTFLGPAWSSAAATSGSTTMWCCCWRPRCGGLGSGGTWRWSGASMGRGTGCGRTWWPPERRRGCRRGGTCLWRPLFPTPSPTGWPGNPCGRWLRDARGVEGGEVHPCPPRLRAAARLHAAGLGDLWAGRAPDCGVSAGCFGYPGRIHRPAVVPIGCVGGGLAFQRAGRRRRDPVEFSDG